MRIIADNNKNVQRVALFGFSFIKKGFLRILAIS